MALGGIGRRVDPDHARGGIDESRRGTGDGAKRFPAEGEPFPNGIGGARSTGTGYVIKDPAVVDAARTRAVDALAMASDGIPAANAIGDLPLGVHRAASWDEFATRFATNERRSDLLGQLRPALDALHGAGITQAIIGGSYVSTKLHPGDVDIAFMSPPEGPAQAKRALAALGERASEVHGYPADALLTEAPTLQGVVPGINVLEFFQRSREGNPRGVVTVSTAPLN
ncbi:MAG: hypothetical protein JWM90_69 [Thermoleophilia bacterium]|nr:hypothetical protein [Thermoleophilia bacterium]